MTVNSIAALFPETKSEIKSFAEQMISSVLYGYTDPLKVKVQLAAMKKTIEEIEGSQDFKNCVMNEAEKYHKLELANLYNSKIEIKETGTKYDYEGAGCEEYNVLIAQKKELDERVKQLENDMKAGRINQVTGEIVIPKATKTSTTAIFVTINR